MAFGQRGIFVVKFSGQLLTGEKAVKPLVAFKTCPAFGCLNFAHDARCTAGAVFFQRRFVFQRTIRTFGRRSNIAFVTLWTHTAFETIDYVSKFTHATTAANIGCDECAILLSIFVSSMFTHSRSTHSNQVVVSFAHKTHTTKRNTSTMHIEFFFCTWNTVTHKTKRHTVTRDEQDHGHK